MIKKGVISFVKSEINNRRRGYYNKECLMFTKKFERFIESELRENGREG